MDEYAGLTLGYQPSLPPVKGGIAPVGKADFGWFTVLQYPRGKRAYIIEGTDIAISPQTYKVLERLAAHGSQSLLPSGELKKLFPESPHATVLLSKALGEIEQIFKQMYPAACSKILERGGHAGTRLFMPADLHLASTPAPQIKITPPISSETQSKPCNDTVAEIIVAAPPPAHAPAFVLPPAKRAFKAANLVPVAAKDMKINGLYLDPASEGWFVFAGETDTSAMEQETSEDSPEDSPRVSMRRLASVRLDGEEAGHLAFDAPTALKIDAVTAYLTLRSAHRRMIELLNAGRFWLRFIRRPDIPCALRKISIQATQHALHRLSHKPPSIYARLSIRMIFMLSSHVCRIKYCTGARLKFWPGIMRLRMTYRSNRRCAPWLKRYLLMPITPHRCCKLSIPINARQTSISLFMTGNAMALRKSRNSFTDTVGFQLRSTTVISAATALPAIRSHCVPMRFGC